MIKQTEMSTEILPIYMICFIGATANTSESVITQGKIKKAISTGLVIEPNPTATLAVQTTTKIIAPIKPYLLNSRLPKSFVNIFGNSTLFFADFCFDNCIASLMISQYLMFL